jgi:hypothetical protein
MKAGLGPRQGARLGWRFQAAAAPPERVSDSLTNEVRCGDAEGLATEEDLPIKDYDKQTAQDIAGQLKNFLRKIDAYERKHENRATFGAELVIARSCGPFWRFPRELGRIADRERALFRRATTKARWPSQPHRQSSRGCWRAPAELRCEVRTGTAVTPPA